jgi:hypothetical protein
LALIFTLAPLASPFKDEAPFSADEEAQLSKVRWTHPPSSAPSSPTITTPLGIFLDPDVFSLLVEDVKNVHE